MGGLKKKHAWASDLAQWYGINPYQLTTAEKIGLLANLPRAQAQRRIYEGNLDGYDYKGVHDLYLLAFDDPALAMKAQTDFLERKVDAECNAAANHHA